ITTMPPVSHMKHDVGSVVSPGCSNTIVGFFFSPSASQNAAPNARAPLSHRLYSMSSDQRGSLPQCSNLRRSITPTAPSFLQNSFFESPDTTATARPPAARTIWIAIEPRPPAPPHTRIGSPAVTTFGDQPWSMRYAVAPTSMYAAASSHVRCGGLGRHWWSCTFVYCAKLPQLDS